MDPIIGTIGAAGVSALSKVIAGKSQQSADEKAAAANAAFQREAAQNSIQWRVADAKKAGINPLAALGAQVFNPSPITAGSSAAYDSIAGAGQDIGRAVQSVADANSQDAVYQARVRALGLQRMELDNQLLASKISTEQQNQSMPGIPAFDYRYPIDGQPDSRAIEKVTPAQRTPVLKFHGRGWMTDPGFSDSQSVEDAYAEGVSIPYGVYKFWNDLWYNNSVPNRGPNLFDYWMNDGPNPYR